MNAVRRFHSSFVLAALVAASAAASAQAPATILHAPEAAKLLPDAVYYAGKSANTQLRNSAGLRFADGHYVLAVLVDTSGYSSAVQEKYQGYFLTEVSINIDGRPLPPGAYGIGFVGDRFIVTDIGAHDVLEAHAHRDDQMERPMPLKIVAGDTPDRDRLCFGRSCVVLSRP
ncbi:MAG TPA: hypothetical protein VL990_14490 [Acidobacteriaceae bacterium]|nr:hypothetical protein [Acidobacteriaceae bacterium]